MLIFWWQLSKHNLQNVSTKNKMSSKFLIKINCFRKIFPPIFFRPVPGPGFEPLNLTIMSQVLPTVLPRHLLYEPTQIKEDV